MLGWIRRVIFRRPSPPDLERAEKAQQLDDATREVRAQTVQVNRIRREALLAEQRFRK